MDTELEEVPKNHQQQEEEIDNGEIPLLKSDSCAPQPSQPQKQQHHQQQQQQQRPSNNHESAGKHTPSSCELEEMEKRCAAYVRDDVYGPMGCGEIPISEKVLLGVAMVTLVPLRVVIGMTILVTYYLICKVCTLFSTPYREGGEQQQQEQEQEQEDYAHLGGWRREVIVHCGRFLSRALLFTMGFYWISSHSRVSDPHNLIHQSDSTDQLENSEMPGVVISNHVSYLDILYHMSSTFPSFVAKRSVGKLPLVGLISKCLGCVYVQREDKSSDFKGVSGVVTERIKEAHSNNDAPLMLIFPEGTTTNGNFLLPFKTGAFIAGAPVLPVILKYPYERFSPAWDSISGVRHVILLLCQFVNYMVVMKLPIYYPSKEEKDDPKLFANNLRKLMANEGDLIMSDIGLPEKRIYHAALNGNNSPRSVFHQKTE